MAKNRTELETQVDTDIVATLAIADHRTFLKNELIDSAVLRKDVIASQTVSGASIAIDFSTKDLCPITITANIAVSFTGMENGDVKYLAITKNAGNTISFTGATDTSIRRSYINATALTVIYQVFYKNGVISVQSINVENDLDIQTDWINATIDPGFNGTVTQTIKYRINKNGSLEIVGAISGGSGGSADEIFFLPAGFRPAYQKEIPVGSYDTTLGYVPAIVNIQADGEVHIHHYPGSSNFSFATFNITVHID